MFTRSTRRAGLFTGTAALLLATQPTVASAAAVEWLVGPLTLAASVALPLAVIFFASTGVSAAAPVSTTRVSVGQGGAEGNGLSANPAISGDGRFVVFWSDATNLVSSDSNNASDVGPCVRKGRCTDISGRAKLETVAALNLPNASRVFSMR